MDAEVEAAAGTSAQVERTMSRRIGISESSPKELGPGNFRLIQRVTSLTRSKVFPKHFDGNIVWGFIRRVSLNRGSADRYECA